MPVSWDDEEPVLLPDAGDYDDVLARAGRKRRARLNRFAVLSTLPLVAAAVTFALRPAVPQDSAGLHFAKEPTAPVTSEAPDPAATGFATAGLPGPPAPAETPSPAPSRRPTRRPTATRPPRPPSTRPTPAAPSSKPRPPRVEAETGEIVNPGCGDGGDAQQMQVENTRSASGGKDVFHPAAGCSQAFPNSGDRVVTRIVFRVGGQEGEICGHFEIDGSQIGESEYGCWTAFEYISVEVDSLWIGGSDGYTVTWVNDQPTPEYVNAHVDYHELG